tara:strand:- start:4797 stop:6260 length:1464 start_codon:yes stop_codon:yes gene_type:complete
MVDEKGKGGFWIIFVTVLLLVGLAVVTVPHDLLDVTDVTDYSDTAKFFAGQYQAKYRSSHSIIYGLLLSPYVKLTGSFFVLKLITVFWLFLLIVSLYYISEKNKKTLWLFVTAPFIWYMAPWLSPVPIVALLFLWAYFFIRKFENEEKVKYVIYSSILLGLSAIFWDAALYFAIIFLVSFLYNKKFFFSWIFLAGILIGLIPRLIINQMFFDMAFFGVVKNFLALSSFLFEGGIYHQGYSGPNLLTYLIVFLFTPFFYWMFYKKKNFLEYKKTIIFLTLSLVFILLNPQIRVIVPIAPIMILILGENLNKKRFKIQIALFLILSLLVVTPYLIQTKYEVSSRNIEKMIGHFPDIEIGEGFREKLIIEDLERIEMEFPGERFVVGDFNDAYVKLAHFYWGKGIKEFIAIEDYRLWDDEEYVLASKEIRTNAQINARREMAIILEWGRNSKDETDYDSIKYGISFERDLGLDGFEFVKKYKTLYLFEKV